MRRSRDAVGTIVKDVHKSPALELVGWFTAIPPTGPEPEQLPIHQQLLRDYNETALLLAFHPSSMAEASSTRGKLPLTIYESVYEGEKAGDGDKSMQIDGQEQSLSLKFRELPYSIETGEAEMISVDFVARGGGNATAVQDSTLSQAQQTLRKPGKDASGEATEEQNGVTTLSPEDEDCKFHSICSCHVQILTVETSNRWSHNTPECRESFGVPHTLNEELPL